MSVVELCTFKHRSGTIQAAIDSNGNRRFTYTNTGDALPHRISTVPLKMLWFMYEQLTTRTVPHEPPVIDPATMSYARFMGLMHEPQHIYLEEFNWALSADGRIYARSPDDRVATTEAEIAAVRTQAAHNRTKFNLLK